ncbi:MAG: 1,4-alpha-glucan branching protein GlgB, partial [Lachnospiraceae bacterium]|nr:1,4-alpha-glucan branching protein GlgB [Lachnospiraceae bacterium]
MPGKKTVKVNEKTIKNKPAGKGNKKTKIYKTVKKDTVSKVVKNVDNDPFITEMDQYLFGTGTHYDIYKKLGAHPAKKDGKDGYYFAVWAPNALKVHLIGDFNSWNEEANEMERHEPNGIYDCFVEGMREGVLYKYLIEDKEGNKHYKADPFANRSELRPGTASVTTDISNLNWTDSVWMKRRRETDITKEPIAIYECHIGSWMRHPGRDDDGFYNYREFADRITDYLLDMHYTHIELIGIAEHPFDGSWGYQVTGYYAPTSRYGTCEDFMYLVNKLHKNHIGVILDWVPAHFPKDAHGLAEFDGSCLYEYADPRKGEHPDWGTKIFDYGKAEVKNFLIANAIFWLREFHVDGLRVDAVASMLYLDYGKQDGQWVPNEYGDNKNLEAIEFFKHLNSYIKGVFPGAMMIAEESTAWPKVTDIPENDGLGFTFKWNMGWMHDFCDYMKLDPIFRKDNHYKMTFAMSYNYAERYILVLSHDEVVHLKCSMLNKMPGYYVDKFANLRVGYTYMMGHAGKKLLFMGQEFAQDSEWNEAKELDWALLEDGLHSGMQSYVRDLLAIYNKYPCMYECDYSEKGFMWINADDTYKSIYSFVRRSENKKNSLLFVMNFTPIARDDYRVGVPEKKRYKLILDSDEKKYGGSGEPREVTTFMAEKMPWDGQPYSIGYKLPPYGAAVFQF